MTGLDYYSVDEQVIGTNEIGLPGSPALDVWFHPANISAEFSAYADLGSPLNFSDLPGHQGSALINWGSIRDQEVVQFPKTQNNSHEQQNTGQHDSETWFAWALGRNVFSDADIPVAFSMSPVFECSPNKSLSTPNFPFGVNQLQSSVINRDYISPSSPQALGNLASAHGRLLTGLDNECSECSITFLTKAALYLHSKELNHSPYSCLCGNRFSRLDVLDRHVNSSCSFSTTYPCPHCKKYSGTRAFRRRDHLTQHLKGYHRMEISSDSEASLLSQHKIPPAKRRSKIFSCPHEIRLDNRSTYVNKVNGQNQAENTFQTQSQLTQHLREIHDESLFPCREAHCSRIGRKGFFRKKDLMKHMRKHHPSSQIISELP